MIWLMYLRFMALQVPPEETVRVRITGFGTPDGTGGGDAAAEGDIQPASGGGSPAQGAATVAAASSPTSPLSLIHI